MQGKLIIDKSNFKENFINVESLSIGIYILTIEDSNNEITEYKFIKK